MNEKSCFSISSPAFGVLSVLDFSHSNSCIMVLHYFNWSPQRIYMQSTSWEMLDWMKHKLESRLPREVSITSDMQMTPLLWQKVKKNKKPLEESERGKWKSWLKTQHSKNEDHGIQTHSVQFSSVAQLCPTLCDPMNRSAPGLPVHHHLPESTQTHVHRVGEAIQPSHPLSSPSPPAPNPSQHQSLFQWVNSSLEVAKVLEFQL